MQSVKRASFVSAPMCHHPLPGRARSTLASIWFCDIQFVMFEETPICCSPTSLQLVSPRTLSWKLPKWPYVTWPWLDLVSLRALVEQCPSDMWTLANIIRTRHHLLFEGDVSYIHALDNTWQNRNETAVNTPFPIKYSWCRPTEKIKLNSKFNKIWHRYNS